jgi:hypothetical protein
MIENKIKEFFENKIIITSIKEDYILISEIVIEFKNFIKEIELSDDKVKLNILKYLKTVVKIEPYISIVVEQGKKRGYPGIKWKIIEETLEKAKHYNLSIHYNYKELINNTSKRIEFFEYIQKNIKEINWPPVNINYYNSLLQYHSIEETTNLKMEVNNLKMEINNNINLMLEELSNRIVETIINRLRKPKSESMSLSMNNNEKLKFEIFLENNLKYNPEEIKIIYNSEILEEYYKSTNLCNIASNTLYKILKEYIFKKYCDNKIIKLEAMKSKSKSKPSYYKGISIKKNVF